MLWSLTLLTAAAQSALDPDPARLEASVRALSGVDDVTVVDRASLAEGTHEVRVLRLFGPDVTERHGTSASCVRMSSGRSVPLAIPQTGDKNSESCRQAYASVSGQVSITAELSTAVAAYCQRGSQQHADALRSPLTDAEAKPVYKAFYELATCRMICESAVIGTAVLGG